MKFHFPYSGIVLSVIASVMAVFLLYTGFVYVFYDHVTENVEESREQFEHVKKQNKEYVQSTKLKNNLTHVVKDVVYTNLILLDQLKENNQNEVSLDVDLDDKRSRTWNKRIIPSLDSIDNDISLIFNNEIKATFNRISDQIYEINLLQEQIIADVKTNGSYAKKDLSDLKSKGYSLSENFNTFLQGDVSITTETFVLKKRDDDVIKLIAVAFIVVALVILITNLLINYLKKPIKKLDKYLVEVRNGNLPGELTLLHDDYNSITRSVNFIVRRLYKIRDFAAQVARRNFDTNIIFERDGQFGNTLADMQDSLHNIAKEDKQRTHINEGLSDFSEILGNNTNNLKKFCEEVIVNLVRFLNANQGAMFVVNRDDDGEEYLEMMACYAYNKKKYMHRKVQKGQGLAGQAWLEGQRIYMTKVPDNYVTITSGLGFSTPRCVLIIPLIFNEQTHGVIELASFQELEDYELGFVERVSESISSSLASVKVNATTQALLTQAEDLTVQMREQEDEMRKHVDELRMTQQESQEREEKYIREIKRLKKRLQAYERNF